MIIKYKIIIKQYLLIMFQEYNFRVEQISENPRIADCGLKQITQQVNNQTRRNYTENIVYSPRHQQSSRSLNRRDNNQIHYQSNQHKALLKPVNQHSINKITQKIQRYRNQKEKNIHRIQNETQRRVMQECTFKPQVNKNYNRTHKNIKQFLQRQDKHLKKIEQNIEQRKLQINQIDNLQSTYHPKINTNYKVENKPAYQRLYEKYQSERNKKKAQNGQLTFNPVINKKSLNMERNQPVQDLLYADALRRAHKPTPSPNSVRKQERITQIKYVAQKFIKQYHSILNELDLLNKDSLSLLDFGSILKAMGFLIYSHDDECNLARGQKDVVYEAYQIFEEYEANSRNVCVFLMGLVGIYDVNPVNFHSGEDQKKLQLNENNCRRIQKYFDCLFRNRMSNEIKSKKIVIQNQFNHTPQTNRQSINLAEKYRLKMIKKINDTFIQNNINIIIPQKGINHQDLLVIYNISRNLQMQLQRQQKSKQKDPQCSFRPNLIASNITSNLPTQRSGMQKSNELYEIAKIKQEIQKNKEKYILDKTVIKQQSKKSRTPRKTKAKQPNGFRNSVTRMEFGRRMKQQKQLFMKTGQLKRSTKSKPVSPIRQEDPVLVVDVNLDGDVQQLLLYEGDLQHLDGAIYKFCLRNDIDQENQEYLLQFVKEKIQEAGLLQ